ncbi:hypothetical protein BpHYR1_034591 [Brachionus plicatilis]|uniref:Uncharacterized protein n=1 Tax=Brachionus plicatilis TaxID=10195 RepID=A0A3M7QJE0_BRAPC|nr:hypothetical protein BpHYR1_034591 [Brachionus plicatilis]
MPVLNLDMSNIPIYCSPGLSECLSFSFKTNDSTKNLKFYDKLMNQSIFSKFLFNLYLKYTRPESKEIKIYASMKLFLISD